MDLTAFEESVTKGEVVTGQSINTEVGPCKIEGVVLNGNPFMGVELAEDITVVMENASGVIIEDPFEDGELIFVDYFNIDSVV